MFAVVRSQSVLLAAVLAGSLVPITASGQGTQWTPTRLSPRAEARQRAEFGTQSDAVRATFDSRTQVVASEPSANFDPQASSRTSSAARYPTRASVFVDRNHAHNVAPTYSQNNASSRAYAGSTNSGYTSSRNNPLYVSRPGVGPATSAVGVLHEFGVRLAQGEQLVSQPTVTEGGPVGGAANSSSTGSLPSPAPNSEQVPTPDGLSGGAIMPGDSSRRQDGPVFRNGTIVDEQGNVLREGEIIYEDGFPREGDAEFQGPMLNEGEIILDPGMGIQNGRFVGPYGMYDEWREPERCPDCGLYGYHAPGCLRLARCLYGCLGFLFRESSIFAGTQGYKGPADFGLNGNFGFNEGINTGGAIVPFPRIGLGYQIGSRWTQSSLSGNTFGSSAREQKFMTAGIFHRAYRNRGIQWGVVYDYLGDNYFTNSNLGQIRTESSFLNGRGHEFGFMGTIGVMNDTVTVNALNVNVVNSPLNVSDQYNFFYRRTTRYSGQGRFWGGITGQSLMVLGADFRVPMSNRVEMVGGFNYISPDRGQANGGTTDESWGLNMNIVWYFARPREGIHDSPFRPLFQVADNNVLMLERQ